MRILEAWVSANADVSNKIKQANKWVVVEGEAVAQKEMAG